MDDRIYDIGLFIHVLSVAGLFFGMGLEVLHVTMLRRAQTVGQVQQLDPVESVLKRLMPTVTVLIAASGIFMLIKGWSWSAHWAEVALVSLILAAGLGTAVLANRSQKIAEAAHGAPPGPLPESLRAQIMDPVLYTASWVLPGMGAGILYLMTNKPETVESIVAMVVAIALGVGVARLTDRRPTLSAARDEQRVEAGR